MSFKTYEIEGEIFEVSDEKSNQFFEDFKDKKITQIGEVSDPKPEEPKKAIGAAPGVVAEPQISQEIKTPVETPKDTDLVSENTSLDLPDPEPEANIKKELEAYDATAPEFWDQKTDTIIDGRKMSTGALSAKRNQIEEWKEGRLKIEQKLFPEDKKIFPEFESFFRPSWPNKP